MLNEYLTMNLIVKIMTEFVWNNYNYNFENSKYNGLI